MRVDNKPKKSFNVKDGKTGNQYNDTNLNYGRYLCAVDNLRDLNGHSGHWFWFDGEVLAGRKLSTVPEEAQQGKKLTPNGSKFSHGINPEDAKVPPGTKMTRPLAIELETGKIMTIAAAVFGLSEKQVAQLEQDDYDDATTPDPKTNVSPLRGRLVVVEQVYHPRRQAGKDGTLHGGFKKFFPYIKANYPEFDDVVIPAYCSLPPQGDEDSEPEAGDRPFKGSEVLEHKTKAPPASPKKTTYEEAMAKAGFEMHPDDDSYAWSPSTDEVVEHAELKTRLGL